MKVRVLYALLVMWGLASCVSVQTIGFDQLCPAEVSLPEQVKRVAVVNNMPVIPEAKSGVATLGSLNGDGKLTAEALAVALADADYFNQVIICDSALNGQDATDDTKVRPLSKAEIGKLVQELGVDMLLSLDRVFVQNVKKEIRYPGLPEAWPVVQTQVTPVLSIYSPVRERPVRVVALTDTLEWDIDRIPSDKALINEVAGFSAHLLARQLTPYWEHTDRIYYAGGCVEMRDAVVCIREGDWEGAKDLWLSLYKRRKSGKVKARAALNLALASEMLGDMDGAKKWLEEAGKQVEPGSEEEMVYKYASLKLEERLAGFSHLQIQMRRFDNNLSE